MHRALKLDLFEMFIALKKKKEMLITIDQFTLVDHQKIEIITFTTIQKEEY
jgi:hypothetical protein